MSMGSHRLRAVLPVAALVLASGVSMASPGGVRMSVIVVGPDPLGAPGRSGYHAEILAQGDALRVDFVTAMGRRGTLLQPADDTVNWLMDPNSDAVLPFQGEGMRGLLVDPTQPCGASGGRCRSVSQRTFGDIHAIGWRYSGARNGPGGTREGTMWVDAQRGMVVAYEGRVGRERRSMHPIELRDEPLSPDLFRAPKPPPSGVVPRIGSRR